MRFRTLTPSQAQAHNRLYNMINFANKHLKVEGDIHIMKILTSEVFSPSFPTPSVVTVLLASLQNRPASQELY